MPQLVVQDFVPQLVWLAISFCALYVIMARVAIPRIARAIEHRHSKIADDLDMAQRLKEQSEKVVARHQAALTKARTQAHEFGQDAREKLAAEISAEKTRADAALAQQTADAEARLAAIQTQALKEVRIIAAQITGDIVVHLTGRKSSEQIVARSLDAARS